MNKPQLGGNTNSILKMTRIIQPKSLTNMDKKFWEKCHLTDSNSI